MFNHKQRIQKVNADYIKEENGRYHLVNKEGSYKRLLLARTFLAIRHMVEVSHKQGNATYYTFKK